MNSVNSSTPTRSRTALEFFVVAAAFAAISISGALTQPMKRLFADAEIYHAVAVKFFESDYPINAQVPWAYRIATPWLAAKLRPAVSRLLPQLDSQVEHGIDRVGVTPFLVLNIVASAAAVLLLLLYLRRFINSAIVRVILVVAWMAMWHSPVRWVYFYPVNVDAMFMVCLIGGFLIMEVCRDRSPLTASLLLAPIVFIGALVREAMLLVPLAFGVAQLAAAWRDRRLDRLVAATVPVVALALAWLVVRSIVVPAPGHQQWAEVDSILRNKPLWTWVLGWFFTFGPSVIALIIAGRAEVWAFLRARPEIAAHLAACGVLGYIAGTGSDTERLLAWGAPAVYVLAGHAITARRFVLARMPLLVTLLIVVQTASSRILWAIPLEDYSASRTSDLQPGWSAFMVLADKSLIINNYYSNLWSYYGSRPVHAATLAFDLALTFVVVQMIRRSAAIATGHGDRLKPQQP